MKRLHAEELSDYKLYNPNSNQTLNDVLGFDFVKEEDGWESVNYYTRKQYSYEKGIVYILENECIPGLVKIGFTTKNAYSRAKEISTATGVPKPFEVKFIYECNDPYSVEQEIHNELNKVGKRINRKREFFELELQKAIELVKEIGSKYKGKILPLA